ncbi:facilitated trehalose transporter Tret1-1-like [Battus philenor]|uniref:facilitated trehalose transporter Tret1-1-like n=1 Tax=Battus philenor TaxID=42288 RepID=UPI0035D0E896
MDEHAEENKPYVYEKVYASMSFWRQALVSSGVWTMFFLTGMLVGAPTVFIPQIRREVNSTFEVDDETASWLYSVYGFGAIPWVLVVPTVSQYIGRRVPFILASINAMLVFIVLYFSTTTKQIIIAEIMQGYFQACDVTICIIILSEYTAPKYRGVFLTLKTASFFWGFWASNAIGTFLHWKYIAIFGIVICCHTFTSFFWPESPQWLASRGRFDECKKSFRWLNGYTEDSEMELKKLIESQTQYLKRQSKNHSKCNLSEYNSMEFYKPLLLITVLVTQYFFTGKFVSSVYILDIIKKITGSDRTAYTGMLVLDGVTVLGVYIGCGLTKIFNRRTMYLVSSVMGLFFLFVIALYLYLVKLTYIVENKILSVVLLTCFSIVISGGPMCLTTALYGEIIPLKYKTSLFLIVACEYMLYSTGVLKLAPVIFRAFGLHGTFFMYGIITAIATYILYLYMPETKDKTLQEIEEYFKDKEPKSSAQSKEENELFVTRC